jgi:hypothetical protein
MSIVYYCILLYTIVPNYSAVVGIYRVYTKEWCGFPLLTIETAPFFCVHPVYDDCTYCMVHEKFLMLKPRFQVLGNS